jgi:hypothetical protein
MQITMQVTGLDKVQKQLAKLSGAQAAQAYAKAINDTAYQVRRAMQGEMAAVFDRPTPYILRSSQVKQATPERLQATVEPTYYGGKGVDPQKILAAQADGGQRRDKRSEVALRRIGILPAGYQTVVPENPFPGSEDGYGGIKGSFLARLLSYFQAFGEQGYRANMKDSTKARLRNQQGIGSIRSKKTYQTILGFKLFVSYGRLIQTSASHLPPGIWAASGTHGVNVRPVLMFVKAGAYKPRLSMERVAQKAGASEYLARRLRYRIRQAAGE